MPYCNIKDDIAFAVMSRNNGKKSVVYHGTKDECEVERYRRSLIERTTDAFVIQTRENKPSETAVWYIHEGSGMITLVVDGKKTTVRQNGYYILWDESQILGRFDTYKELKAHFPSGEVRILTRDHRRVWKKWVDFKKGVK